MSVTFSPEITGAADTRTFRLTCSKGDVLGDWTGYSNAYAEAQAHGLLCDGTLCQGYGADLDEVGAEPSVNVCNRNAADLLTVLGYPVDLEAPELCGDADAADFAARVTLAAAMEPDGTLTEIVVTGVEFLPGVVAAGTYVSAGREASYLTDRLAELQALAAWCVENGRRVVWG